MSQITSGIRSILSSSMMYNFLQNILGAHKVRQELVEDFILPQVGFRILDLGCGTAEILKYLPNTIEYWGYDISPEYIAAAKAEHGARGSFYCGLLKEAHLIDLPKFDIVLALGVLHHLSDVEVDEFFSLANNALRTGGRVITIDPCLIQNQNPIAKYLIKKDRGQNVRELEEYSILANNVFTEMKGTLRHRKWIPYTHWVMECYK